MFHCLLSAVIPVAAATMTPLPLLAALIVLKIKEAACTRKDKLPLDQDESSSSIIKTKTVLREEVKDSESTLQLVQNASNANDNSIA